MLPDGFPGKLNCIAEANSTKSVRSNRPQRTSTGPASARLGLGRCFCKSSLFFEPGLGLGLGLGLGCRVRQTVYDFSSIVDETLLSVLAGKQNVDDKESSTNHSLELGFAELRQFEGSLSVVPSEHVHVNTRHDNFHHRDVKLFSGNVQTRF